MIIEIISCTNRPESRTKKIAGFYAALLAAEHGLKADVLSLCELPHDFVFTSIYGDAKMVDPAFTALRERVARAEAIVFVLPEYNGSFPGVLKAFIDGLHWPSDLADKPVAMLSLSAGTMGGALAMSHLTDVMHYYGAMVLPTKPRLPRVQLMMDKETGEITDGYHLEIIRLQQRQLAALATQKQE